MQSLAASCAKIAPATQVAQTRRSNHTVICHAVNEEKRSATPLKNAAIAAGISALILAGEPNVALAKSATATPSQGELLEQLLEKQKKGEVKAVTIKGSSQGEKAVYGKNKSKPAPAPVANKAPAPKAAAKKAPSPKPVSKPAASKPLKFDSKAGSGSQGVAPSGLELPVPKGAIKKVESPKPKPAAPAKKMEAPKPAAPVKKVEAPKPAAPVKKVEAPKPAAPKKTENPLARKAKVAATAAGAGAVAAEKLAAPKPAPTPAAKPAPKASTSSAGISLKDGGVQAGAVAAAELVGVLIASSVVNSILKPQRS